MARTALNALQAIIIRERLILYLEHRRQAEPGFSIRALIEAIAFSEANAHEARIYKEEDDTGERYDAGLPLKNNTIGNLVARKASATADDNLPLIRNFLVHEGFLSPNLLRLGARHPDPWLGGEFAGLASTDARLQPHRYELEGEYLRNDHGDTFNQLWIAAPGRSKPFVTLQTATYCPAQRTRPSLKCVSLEGGLPKGASEGRIFLMPGKTLVLIEVSLPKEGWTGQFWRVRIENDALVLTDPAGMTRSFARISRKACETAQRSRYRIRDGIRSSGVLSRDDMAGRRPSIRLGSSWQDVARSLETRPSTEQQRLDSELLAAAAAGDAKAVIAALVKGANINARNDGTGRTAAHLAAAANAPDAVLALTLDGPDELIVFRSILEAAALDRQALGKWRLARQARDPLKTDNEGCYPSACAPIGFDDSQRNRSATAIWCALMKAEMQERSKAEFYGGFAQLEFWKPSSVMAASLEGDYSAK